MKFLIDTNILLPLEPVAPQGITTDAQPAMEVARLVNESGNQLLVHPLVSDDIANDRDLSRRQIREHALSKYPKLVDPPGINAQHRALIGTSIPGTNDWVDDNLLVAVERHAVDYLVTQDQGIHKKAAKLQVTDRVLTVADAIAILRALFDAAPPPPPAVSEIKLYNIDATDPIFDGFRADYSGFDEWLRRAKLQDRPTWAIRAGDRIAAICIAKREEEAVYDASGKTLKICSFKVADDFQGARFGELLLKTLFGYAANNGFDWIYVTVFEKHSLLIKLFQDFGFEVRPERTPLSELVLTKPLHASDPALDPLAALPFFIRYGPCCMKWPDATGWIVPIKPRYADLLFPEQAPQTSLFPGSLAFGNSIRKAYLCHSRARNLHPGEFLAFYRSQDVQAITTLGVVERILRSTSAEEIGQFVSRRTVYSMAEIRRLCGERTVLAIQFRQVLINFPPIKSRELAKARAFTRPPESLMRFPAERVPWLKNRILQ